MFGITNNLSYSFASVTHSLIYAKIIGPYMRSHRIEKGLMVQDNASVHKTSVVAEGALDVGVTQAWLAPNSTHVTQVADGERSVEMQSL